MLFIDAQIEKKVINMAKENNYQFWRVVASREGGCERIRKGYNGLQLCLQCFTSFSKRYNASIEKS